MMKPRLQGDFGVLQVGGPILGRMSNRATIICSLSLAALGIAAAGLRYHAAWQYLRHGSGGQQGHPQHLNRRGIRVKPFNLASTLDGKTVLPHRIHLGSDAGIARLASTRGGLPDRRQTAVGRAQVVIRLRGRRRIPGHELAYARQAPLHRARDPLRWPSHDGHAQARTAAPKILSRPNVM